MNRLLFSGKTYVDSCMHFPPNERSSEAGGFSGSQQCGAAVKALGQKGAATEGLARPGSGASTGSLKCRPEDRLLLSARPAGSRERGGPF